MQPVSVVIPFHSNVNYLFTCLYSICSSVGDDTEIIVVLNNQDADELPSLHAFPNIKCLYFKESLGFSRACNIGAEHATGRFLAFCDADIMVRSQDWLSQHLYQMINGQQVGATGSLMLNPDDGCVDDYTIGWSGYNHIHPCRGAKSNDPRLKKSRQAQMLCSAHMMISRELFLSLGGFDERLKYHYQDVDLCLQLKRKGYKNYALGQCQVYHRGKSANVSRSPFQIDERGYYTAKNHDILETDVKEFCSESFDLMAARLSGNETYELIEISTIYDNRELLQVASDYINFEPLLHQKARDRDLSHVNLFELLGRKITARPSPFLYLVDQIKSLKHNDIWSHIRASENDLVLDRHGNTCLITDL